MPIIVKGVLIGFLLIGLGAVALALLRWAWCRMWNEALGYRGDHAR